MSETNGQSLDPVELVSLPVGDRHRVEFAKRLSKATAEERSAWEAELAVTDRLREMLPQVNVPAGMEQRVLKIIDKKMNEKMNEKMDEKMDEKSAKEKPLQAGAAPIAVKRGLLVKRVDWRAAAAVLLVAGLTAAYLLWPREMPPPMHLDNGVRSEIATWAVKHHAAATDSALEVTSSDAEMVQKVLAAHALDFPVMMLKPSEGELRGGGTCDLGPAKAVYTQWRAAGMTYTLYEFNGKEVGAPPEFLPTVAMPKELWQGDLHYQVVMWPGQGGKCCWALVMEKEDARNIFARYGYGT